MSSQGRHLIPGSILAATAILACLMATLRTDQRHLQKDGLGSPEQAFDRASSVIKDYISTTYSDPIGINSQYSATLHNQSKLWTIKGYASCRNDHKKSYRWTVILEFHDTQDWEILAKIVTPEFSAPNSNQVEGVSQAQGELLQSDNGQCRNRE